MTAAFPSPYYQGWDLLASNLQHAPLCDAPAAWLIRAASSTASTFIHLPQALHRAIWTSCGSFISRSFYISLVSHESWNFHFPDIAEHSFDISKVSDISILACLLLFNRIIHLQPLMHACDRHTSSRQVSRETKTRTHRQREIHGQRN